MFNFLSALNSMSPFLRRVPTLMFTKIKVDSILPIISPMKCFKMFKMPIRCCCIMWTQLTSWIIYLKYRLVTRIRVDFFIIFGQRHSKLKSSSGLCSENPFQKIPLLLDLNTMLTLFQNPKFWFTNTATSTPFPGSNKEREMLYTHIARRVILESVGHETKNYVGMSHQLLLQPD